MAVRTLILLAVLVIAGGYSYELKAKGTRPTGLPDMEAIPRTVGNWYSQDYPLGDQVAEVLAADVTLQRRYWNTDGEEVWLFVAYFARQAVNSQIHSPRHCVPGAGWDIISIDPTEVSAGGKTWPATRLLLSREGRSQEMLYWFRTRGGVVSGEYALKWDLVKNSLARRPTDAVFIRYVAPAEEAGAMQEMIDTLHPHIAAALAPLEIG